MISPIPFASPIALFLALVFAHLLGDYPLQGDFLARAKNHRAPVAGVPWMIALVSHAFIQGGLVALVTGSIALGVAEYVLHMLIDHAKSDGAFGDPAVAFGVDQLAHVLCKLLWMALVLMYTR